MYSSNPTSPHASRAAHHAYACFRLIALALIGLSFNTTPVWAQRDTSSYQSFVDDTAELVYFLAWPTATYERVSFEGVSLVYGGVDIKIMLHGRSFWDDSHLWTEVVLEVRNGEISDIRWGRNNAFWAQPGETIEALGEALEELTREYNRTQGGNGSSNSGSSSSGGYSYHFTNRCQHPIRLAIYYEDRSGQWRAEGWWVFAPSQSANLASADDKRLKSNNGVWYFYAETTDGSRWVWAGDKDVYLNGRKLTMKKRTDMEGDNNWSTTCG